ncbi:MAG TPA: NUDIX domain-containing protein [Acidimicrobiales bacterium]
MDGSSGYPEPAHCSACGHQVRPVDAHGEPAWACQACGQLHFRRPTVGVAVVVVEDGRILLVRRRYGARAGLWCIPCGHVGWDEDIRAAGARELLEETGLQVEVGEVLEAQSNFWRPDRQTVGVWFAGRRVGGTLRAGDDAADAAFFDFDDLPELAFATDRSVLDQLVVAAATRRSRTGPAGGSGRRRRAGPPPRRE